MAKQPFFSDVSDERIEARPILSVLEGLSSDELARLAVDVIRENRRRLDRTQSLYDQLEKPIAGNAPGPDPGDLQRDYHMALLELKLHHELVRLVIDVLGHVPETTQDRPIQ